MAWRAKMLGSSGGARPSSPPRLRLGALAPRLIAVAILLAVMGSARVASALPRPPQGASGLRYFGYFDDLAFDDAAATADHANMVLYGDRLETDPTGQQTVSELKGLLASPSTRTMGVMLAVQNVFFHQADASPRDPADWQKRWNDYKAAIKPYLANIVAFYIRDEPNPADSALMAFLGTISAQIRDDYKVTNPNIHRVVVFATEPMDLTPNWTIPTSLDWIGYDCYPGPFEECFDREHNPNNGDNYHFRSIPYYYGVLRQAIARTNAALPAGSPPYRPGLVSLPQAYVTVQDEPSLLARVEREVTLAENDPDFVMIMPFRWALLSSLPIARAYYKVLGQHVVNGTSRLAYPTSVRASSSAPGAEAVNAFDYSSNTAWSAGTYPLADISASFADPIVATKISSMIAQTPAGFTEHALKYANFAAQTGTLTWFTGTTQDSQVLTWTGSQPLNYVDLFTQNDPSWVSWKDISIYTSGTTRLYPSPLAASSGADSLISMVDGDTATAWGSGGYQPASADFDVRTPQTISHIQLVVMQTPHGTTTHTVYGGPSLSSLTALNPPITGDTSDGQVIDLYGSWSNIRYLRVATTQSPSWVAWREINVFR